MSETTFFDLPAELRVNIYERVLVNCTDGQNAPTPISLEQYHGLILACKQVKREFEYECVKAFNVWLLEAADMSRIQPSTPPSNASLRDAQHVHLTFSEISAFAPTEGLTKLVAKLASFTLRPDTTFLTNDNDTVTQFIASRKKIILEWLKQEVHGCIRRAGKNRNFRGNTALYISYWPHELYYTRTATVVPNLLYLEDRFCFPRSKRMCVGFLVYRWIKELCRTMNELREYRGSMWASRANRKVFKSTWAFD
jgi:hypothetical protein